MANQYLDNASLQAELRDWESKVGALISVVGGGQDVIMGYGEDSILGIVDTLADNLQAALDKINELERKIHVLENTGSDNTEDEFITKLKKLIKIEDGQTVLRHNGEGATLTLTNDRVDVSNVVKMASTGLTIDDFNAVHLSNLKLLQNSDKTIAISAE